MKFMEAIQATLDHLIREIKCKFTIEKKTPVVDGFGLTAKLILGTISDITGKLKSLRSYCYG